jgi:hypothetical protein
MADDETKKRRVFLHAGMHKTGSTLIQRNLHELTEPGWFYPEYGWGGLNDLYHLLFEDSREAEKKLTSKEVHTQEQDKIREYWQEQLENHLRSGEENIIFSAERISGADAESLVRLRDFFTRYGHAVQVIVYVRPPVSFMASWLQQKILYHQSTSIQPMRLYPNYKRRIGNLDQVFGAENVNAILYDPAKFPNNSVYSDFMARIGLPEVVQHVTSANRSLSLEALALFFAWRRLVYPGPDHGREILQRRGNLLRTLSDIGNTRVKLSEQIVEPVIEKKRADIDWIEARLGRPILDRTDGDGVSVTDEDQLMEIALQQQDALSGLIGDVGDPSASDPQERLKQTLTRLWLLTDKGN